MGIDLAAVTTSTPSPTVALCDAKLRELVGALKALDGAPTESRALLRLEIDEWLELRHAAAA